MYKGDTEFSFVDTLCTFSLPETFAGQQQIIIGKSSLLIGLYTNTLLRHWHGSIYKNMACPSCWQNTIVNVYRQKSHYIFPIYFFVCVSQVDCQGTESTLSDCQHDGFGEVSSCKSRHYAGVLCYEGSSMLIFFIYPELKI